MDIGVVVWAFGSIWVRNIDIHIDIGICNPQRLSLTYSSLTTREAAQAILHRSNINLLG
jgi:hypothetical protein